MLDDYHHPTISLLSSPLVSSSTSVLLEERMWDSYHHPKIPPPLAVEGATVLVVAHQDPEYILYCGISTSVLAIYLPDTCETDYTDTVRCRPLCRYLLCCISAELSIYVFVGVLPFGGDWRNVCWMIIIIPRFLLFLLLLCLLPPRFDWRNVCEMIIIIPRFLHLLLLRVQPFL
jgi:hypothetical protein